MDPAAEITLVATGDGIDTAFALATLDEARDELDPSPWPVFRSLLLLSPVRAADEATLSRKARDLAGLVARDEQRTPARRTERVTRRVLRRLGW
jgi:hypothetical protein